MKITELNFTVTERDCSPEHVSSSYYKKLIGNPFPVSMGTKEEVQNATFDTIVYKIHKFNNGIDKNIYFVAVREDQEQYLHKLSDISNTAFNTAVSKEINIQAPRRAQALMEYWVDDYKKRMAGLFDRMSFIQKIMYIFGWQERNWPEVIKYY